MGKKSKVWRKQQPPKTRPSYTKLDPDCIEDVIQYLANLQQDDRLKGHEQKLINAALVYTKWSYIEKGDPPASIWVEGTEYRMLVAGRDR
jgi:hypothetical protein